jgi:hypothetical protein
VDEEIKKGASFQSEKRNKAALFKDAKKTPPGGGLPFLSIAG